MKRHKIDIPNAVAVFYIGLKDCLGVLLLGCIFVCIGCFNISDPDCSITTKIIGGWLAVLFFGFGVPFYLIFKFSLRNIPYLVVCKTKLYYYIPRKKLYFIIYFKDVEGFLLVRVFMNSSIVAYYKQNDSLENTRLTMTNNDYGERYNSPSYLVTSILNKRTSTIYNVLNEQLSKQTER